MKKLILSSLVSLMLLSSCSTQQRVVYRDCDCPTNRYDYWNRYSWSNPYWGNPYWGCNSWGWNYLNWNNLYWRTPPIIRPNTPSRYERRQTTSPRPSRNNWSNDVDNVYPRRTNTIPNIDSQRQVEQNQQPSRIQSNPSRIQSTPNRYSQPQQRTEQPSRIQSNPSRNNQNTPPSRQTLPNKGTDNTYPQRPSRISGNN